MSAGEERILVVEDDRSLAGLLVEELQDNGYDTRSVADVEAARELLGLGQGRRSIFGALIHGLSWAVAGTAANPGRRQPLAAMAARLSSGLFPR
jgi:CheY-like chemotaxis protein